METILILHNSFTAGQIKVLYYLMCLRWLFLNSPCQSLSTLRCYFFFFFCIIELFTEIIFFDEIAPFFEFFEKQFILLLKSNPVILW